MATSSNKVPDLGDVVVADQAQLRRFLESVREIIQTREGSRGTELQRSALMADLLDLGLITQNNGKYVGVVTPLPGIPGPPGPPGGGVVPDLTPSSDAEFIDVVEGFSYLIVRWVAPTYTQGHGHAYTEVWAAQYSGTGPLPTFSIATLVSKEIGNIYAHQAGLGVQVHFWLVNVSNDGVAQTTPSGGLNGVWGTTAGVPVDHLLDVLTGQITESQLYAALGARINLIDGSGAGSVNARIAVETSNRTTLDGAVHSLYTVRAEASADGRTIVGGFGLAASGLAGEGPRIDFGIRADQFWVAAPAGTTGDPDSVRPFVIRTTETTENGVTIPPGVYMDAAYIVNLVAVYAKIQELVADDIIAADIETVQLKAGTLRVGVGIYSADYIAGVQGWNLSRTSAQLPATSILGALSVSQMNSTFVAAVNAAANHIASLGADSVLTPAEKSLLNIEYNALVGERTDVLAGAAYAGISVGSAYYTNYSSAVDDLIAYMATLTSPYSWTDLTVTTTTDSNGTTVTTSHDTTVSGPTLRSKFGAVYATKSVLLTQTTAVNTTNIISVSSSVSTAMRTNVANILTGSSGITVSNGGSTLTWDVSGNITGGYGMAITPLGIVGVKSGGSPTFALSASTGAATFYGNLEVGGTAVINGNNTAVEGPSGTVVSAASINTGYARAYGTTTYGSVCGLYAKAGSAGVAIYGLVAGAYGFSMAMQAVNTGTGYGLFAAATSGDGVYGSTSYGGYGGRFSSIKSDAGIESAGNIVSRGAWVQAEQSSGNFTSIHHNGTSAYLLGYYSGVQKQHVVGFWDGTTRINKPDLNDVATGTPSDPGTVAGYIKLSINGGYVYLPYYGL